mmetsp:Transcript_2919/g.6986  ORF Transcript_2919/g.6986 Transcript_2919/m.6986 type:complete len:230 (-) Transcript_2919:1266-1955(-)
MLGLCRSRRSARNMRKRKYACSRSVCEGTSGVSLRTRPGRTRRLQLFRSLLCPRGLLKWSQLLLAPCQWIRWLHGWLKLKSLSPLATQVTCPSTSLLCSTAMQRSLPCAPGVFLLLPEPACLPALAFPHQLAVSLPSSSDSRDVELKIPTTKFSNLPHKSRSKKHAIHLIHCPSNLLLFSFSFVSSLHPVLSKPQLTSLFSNHPSITRAASSCPLDLANAMASMPNTLR